MHAQKLQHPRRKRYLLERVTFVEMKPTLHRRDRDLADFANNKPSGMTFDGRTSEAGNFLIRNRHRVRQVFCKTAETTAQDDGHRAIDAGARANHTRSMLRTLV